MGDRARDRFEIPQEMRSMAEAGVRQAREAFAKFMSGAHEAAGSLEKRGESMRTGAKDIGARAIAFAEKNVQSSLDYAQSLVRAKDLSEVRRLHSEYVQAQMHALVDQANEMRQAVGRAAKDAATRKH